MVRLVFFQFCDRVDSNADKHLAESQTAVVDSLSGKFV
jgi:hypothetical protein